MCIDAGRIQHPPVRIFFYSHNFFQNFPIKFFAFDIQQTCCPNDNTPPTTQNAFLAQYVHAAAQMHHNNQIKQRSAKLPNHNFQQHDVIKDPTPPSPFHTFSVRNNKRAKCFCVNKQPKQKQKQLAPHTSSPRPPRSAHRIAAR